MTSKSLSAKSPSSWHQDRRVFWLVSAVLVVLAFSLRLRGHDHIIRADGIRLHDNDTVRRLSRLAALSEAGAYPMLESWDGYPSGCVSHWTRPMDVFLVMLDPLVAWRFPQARSCESAAMLAGPILAAVSLLLLLVVSRAVMGSAAAWLAGLLYTLSYSVLTVSWLGNGDHQNLQHLCLLAFALLWLCDLQGRPVPLCTGISGACLGLAVWISTESMVVVYLWAIAVIVQFAYQQHSLERELRRAGALLVTLLLGGWCEQQSFLAVEWDKISWLQTSQALALVALFGLLRSRTNHRTRCGAAILATSAVIAAWCVAFLLVPAWRQALADQWASFGRANRWVQTAVSEYRSSFSDGVSVSLAVGIGRFTYLLYALPICLAAILFASELTAPLRFALVWFGTATFALAAFEAKLAHLHAIFAPWIFVIGGNTLVHGVARGRRRVRSLANGTLAIAALWNHYFFVPEERGSLLQAQDAAVQDICRFLAEQDQASTGMSVLAPWELGAHLMYYGKTPVVASGYHRNLAGIEDGYRMFLSQPEEQSDVHDLLTRRRVRFVVAWYDRWFLAAAPKILGIDRPLVIAADHRIRFTDSARRTLYWRLRYAGDVPGFKLVFTSQTVITLSDGRVPMFQIYELAPE